MRAGIVLLMWASAATAAEPREAAFAAAKALGRGVNLGNALEAPKEGDWGMTLQADYFRLIRAAGFDHVRVPVKWSAHAGKTAPYTIEPKFFERIDWVLDEAAKHKLGVVLNVHHYDEMDKDPDAHLPRLATLWEQIAARYRSRPESVLFELNNEPHEKLTEAKWNAAIPPVLAAVRKTNPDRVVVVGPAQWNGIWALPKLQLPDDPRLIVTVHSYSPYEFTHQGASWATPKVRALKGLKWEGTDKELAAVRKEFDQAAAWAKKQNRPVYLGEFGSYQTADPDSRAKWTRVVAREAESQGWAWAYWEFGAGFGLYDRDRKAWRQPLLEAALGK